MRDQEEGCGAGLSRRSWTLSRAGSRRDQEEGGELDSNEEVRHFAGPGEIKRREVVLDPRVSPEQIMSREMELGCESWTSFASVVTHQQCYGHCPCDCSTQQLKQRSTVTATQWRRHTALTLLLFWRRSTASSVFRVGARGRAFTLTPLPPPPPPPCPCP